MRGMLSFQLSRMVGCREYRVAMLLSSLMACGTFLMAAVDNSKVADRWEMLSASEVTCINCTGLGWTAFSALWPFLVVLPFATSFIADKKNRCLDAAVVRGGYDTYLRSKVVAAGIGSASVMFIPLLANLLLCYLVFPHNHNLRFAHYQDGMYAKILLGENRLYASYSPTYFLLPLYLFSPFLYQLMYLGILSLFSGLCGAAATACSFRLSRWRIWRFLPLYVFTALSLRVRTIYWDAALMDPGLRYFDPYICNYLAPLASRDCSMVYFGVICLALVLLTWAMLRWASRHQLRLSQG